MEEVVHSPQVWRLGAQLFILLSSSSSTTHTRWLLSRKDTVIFTAAACDARVKCDSKSFHTGTSEVAARQTNSKSIDETADAD